MNKLLSKTLSSDCSIEDKFAQYWKLCWPIVDLYKPCLAGGIYKCKLVSSPPDDAYVFIHKSTVAVL